MPLTPATLTLENGRIVPMIHVPPGAQLVGLADALNIRYCRGAVALVGGAAAFDEPEYELIRQRVEILTNEIAQVAISYNLAVVDGGTPFGAMRIMGDVCREHRYRFPLVGVAPSGKVTWNPGSRGINYEQTWVGRAVDPKKLMEQFRNRTPLDDDDSAFVLVEANEWGDEVEMLAAVAHELAGKRRSLEVLINGGAVAKRDVTAYLKGGGDVIVIAGTGRFADELATAVKAGYSLDPNIQLVLNSNRVHIFSINDAPQLFTNLLMTLGQWSA